MSVSLEVTFAPAEFDALARRDLSGVVCVVFDVLRATTSMTAALANGAREIIPLADIPAAVALRRARPEVLLAGERNGVRILADLTGGVDFDLGNSPREFTPERVRGRSLVMTTTNGTRALRACAGALRVLVGGFVNLGAVVRVIEQQRPAQLILVGSGTLEQPAFEDTLAAGALVDAIWPLYADGQVADSAPIARHLYRRFANDMPAALALGRNGRRLLARSELREDVAFCAQRDVFDLVGELQPDGAVRRLDSAG